MALPFTEQFSYDKLVREIELDTRRGILELSMMKELNVDEYILEFIEYSNQVFSEEELSTLLRKFRM